MANSIRSRAVFHTVSNQQILPKLRLKYWITRPDSVLLYSKGREAPGYMNQLPKSDAYQQLSQNYRNDPRFGVVYDHAPNGADDLTSIRGIDTREAVILNRLGVYYLAQISLWEHREIVAFAGELGRAASALIDEQWVEQARRQCRPPQAAPATSARHLPASLISTISLLACAMLISCLVVYWFSVRTDRPLQGILSADITSLRVPTESRLLASHVQAGDEVFSGDKLVTLEKTEHLTLISLQKGRVQSLEQDLQRAEAQASLDLEWRMREVERELSDARTRAQLIREVKRNPIEPFRSASTSNQLSANGFRVAALPVSRPRFYEAAQRPAQANGLLFIGAAGASALDDVPRPQPLAIPTPTPTGAAQPQQKMVLASEGTAEGVLSIESVSVEMRLQRLEELRQILPQQVQRAAGVESIRAQFQEAKQRLDNMQTLSRDIAVICPGYGKVGQVRYRPGDTMSTGEVMLKILHTERRYVMLNVPTRRVNEIEPGTSVELIFPGNGRFRGKVANLPMLADMTNNGTSLANVRVEPSGRLWPEIPIGSEIDVVIE
jgi:predicted flap endonuclease-1-like 5' DNA nuclease/multidrug resistance efflux pump